MANNQEPVGEPVSDPTDRLYPRFPLAVVVGALVAVLVGVVVVVLVTGGEDVPPEATGDLTYIEGTIPKQPRAGAQIAASIADLTAAGVSAEGDTLLFEAEVATSIPDPLKRSALEFRWDITGADGSKWTLTVAIAKDSQTSLFADTGYGAGTIDQTLRGQFTIEGANVEVQLDAAEIEDFPSSFEWSLSTTLRAFRDDPDSPRVEDRFPDSGVAGFGS